jgi:hypothetical protein
MLTGVNPAIDTPPIADEYPGSLFGLLRGHYEFHVIEPVTALCVDCPDDPRVARSLNTWLGTLASDLSIAARHAILPADVAASLDPLDEVWANFGGRLWDTEISDDRGQLLAGFIDDIQVSSRVPGLHFLHVLLPHQPYEYLPDGRSYFVGPAFRTSPEAPQVTLDWRAAQARQRLLLQAGFVDLQVGRLIERLDELEIYDEAMVIVVADHGVALSGAIADTRLVTPESIGSIGPVPLFIKPPFSEVGQVDDYRAYTVDILPTIADALGFEIPWAVDGTSLLDDERPARTDTVTSGVAGDVRWPSDLSGTLARAREFFATTTPDDPWTLSDAPVGPTDALVAGLPKADDLVPEAGGVLEASSLAASCISSSRDMIRRAEVLAGDVQGLLESRASPAPLPRLLWSTDQFEDVGDPLADRLRVDAVLLVVLPLQPAAAVGLVDRPLHRVGDMLSAYMITWPSTLRAARPMIWMSEVSERRKPSLSASRIATSDTSGRSRPSRSRLMPTSTSNSPSRRSRRRATRSRVSISECR